MKKLILIFSLALTVVFLNSCKDIFEEDKETDDSSYSIADGLKEALRVGTDTAVTRLTASDGYFKDEAIKLLLPPQGELVMNKFKNSENTAIKLIYTSVIQELEEKMVLAINRAAEDAAQEAKPIFVDAITGITIADASDILFGGDTTAATTYLKDNTLSDLVDVYSPKMDASLDKNLVGNVSANSAWDNLVTKYNDQFDNFATKLLLNTAGLNEIEDTDLSDYATEKALNGLFVKVAEEESQIRKDPIARVNDLLKDIFSRLD
jgi:hypothetical protein